MKYILSLTLLLPILLQGQTNGIYDYPPVKKFKVNLFIDKASGKMYDIQTVDSFGKAGVPLQIIDEVTHQDTAYWTIGFTTPFKQENTPLYRKFMDHRVPDFEVRDIQNRNVSSAALRGKIILLNFWSVTCGPCIAEMPDLNRLADSLPGDRFVLLAPALDSLPLVQKFLKTNAFRYDIAPDAAALASLFGITAYPTNLIIDPQGKIVAVIEGLTIDQTTRRPLIKNEILAALEKISK